MPAPRWLLWALSAMTFSGWVATIAGWIVTEIGRQPWLVTGVLRTRDAVGEISGAQLGASLTGYILTYSVLLVSYLVVVTHLARKGADTQGPAPDARAAVPLAADKR
jgi:cytochrome d ubiquinol oxidase subunit I